MEGGDSDHSFGQDKIRSKGLLIIKTYGEDRWKAGNAKILARGKRISSYVPTRYRRTLKGGCHLVEARKEAVSQHQSLQKGFYVQNRHL